MNQVKRVAQQDAATPNKPPALPEKGQVIGSVVPLAFPTTLEHPHLSSLTDSRSTYASVARSCLQLSQCAGAADGILHDASYSKAASTSLSALMDCVQSHDDRRCRILACKTLALVARAAYARLRHTPLLFGVRDGTLHRLEDEVGTDVPVALCCVALEDVDDGVSACAVEALGMLALSSSSMVGTSVEDVLLREVEAIANARPSPYAPSLLSLSDEDPAIPQMELQSRIYENVMSPRLWRLIRRILHYESSQHVMRTLPFLTASLGHLVKITPFGMDRAIYAKRWVEVDSLGMVQDVVDSLLLPAMRQNDGSVANAAASCALRLAHVCPNATWVTHLCSWAVTVLIEQTQSSELLEHKMATLATLLIALRVIPLPDRTHTLEFVANQVRFLPSTTRVPANVVSAGVSFGNHHSYRRPARIGLLAELALSFFVDGPVQSSSTSTSPSSPSSSSSSGVNVRSKALKTFLTSSEVTAMLTARSGKKRKSNRSWASNQSVDTGSCDGTGSTMAPGGKTPSEEYVGTHVGEEIVLAFCQVASQVGQRVMIPMEQDASQRSPSSGNLEDWLRCSLTVLSNFSPCLNWKSRTLETLSLSEEDHDVRTLFTMLAASQASYLRLLYECLYTVGLLSPTSSISLHLMPLATPRKVVLLEQLAEATVSLAGYETVRGCDFAHKDLETLTDQFLEYKLREGIPSRHVRVSLLALLTDHWVQSRHLATMGQSADDGREIRIRGLGSMNMNEMNARELLATLSEEISSLSKEIGGDQQDGHDVTNTASNMQYLRVCVACVENVALTACDWSRRFGTNRSSNARESYRKDIEEDSSYIVSVALAALKGMNLRDGDVLDDDKAIADEKSPILPLCEEATKRVVGVAEAGDSSQLDEFGIGGKMPALVSTLVTEARVNRPTGRGLKFAAFEASPYVSESSPTDQPLLKGDSFHHAHLWQYCQQVISSRVDLSVLSSPLADVDAAADSAAATRNSTEGGAEGQIGCTPNVTRARNWMRLSVPPLPTSRLSKIPVSYGTRICWKGSVSMVTGGSDPVAVMLAYAVRRCPRYDCESEYKVHVTMRMYNITAVEIPKGVRMDLGVTQQDGKSITSNAINEDETEPRVLASANAIYKQKVRAADHVTWEVVINNWSTAGTVTLYPSITFREIEVEQESSNMVGISSRNDGTKKSDRRNSIEKATKETSIEEEHDVTLAGEPIRLSPMVIFQPCPLVFFRDGCGDRNAFRFLWFQMPFSFPPVKLSRNPASVHSVGTSHDDLAYAVSYMSCLSLAGEAGHGGVAVKAWAFMTLCGKRVFCVMTDNDGDLSAEGSSDGELCMLHFRADDEDLMMSLVSAQGARDSIVTALTDGHWRCHE